MSVSIANVAAEGEDAPTSLKQHSTSLACRRIIPIAFSVVFVVLVCCFADEPTRVGGFKEEEKKPNVYHSTNNDNNTLKDNNTNEGKRRLLESCIWYPGEGSGSSYRDTPCMKIVTRRILASYSQLLDQEEEEQQSAAPLRWLFLGDSTVGKLFNHGKLRDTLLMGPAIEKACPSELTCYHGSHERCHLNEAFSFPQPTTWRAPNVTLGEGPALYGLNNTNCQDCSGCQSSYTVCHRKDKDKDDAIMNWCVLNSAAATKTTTTNNSNASSDHHGPVVMPTLLYGGYFSIEFARDVEIQTPDYTTKQENIANFLHTKYNGDPWLLEKFGGPPICVVSTGIHDMIIPNITLKQYLVNVEWFLELLLVGPCGHVIWLQNTAPARKDAKDTRWAQYPQTQINIGEWNRAVHHHLNTTTTTTAMMQQQQHHHPLPLDRLTIVDVFNASINYPHRDNIHLTRDWYIALGSFFRQVAQQLIIITGSNSLSESK